MTKLKTCFCLAMILGLISAAAPAFSSESDVAEFYKDKTVQIMIGYSAGGGYDRYARVLGRHMGKHIPGNPTIVMKNVPGAGTLVLTNQLAHTLPRDGTVFGIIARGAAFEPLFGNEQARFNPTELGWLGSLASGTSLCVAWHDQPVKTWQDLRTKTLTVGSTGAGADDYLFPRVIADLFDFKIKSIAGYPGSNDINLAMERGEVGGQCGWSWSSAQSMQPEWFENGKVNILFQMALEKHPDLTDVPLVMDFAETEEQTQTLRLLFARNLMGRPFVAPPEVPAERMAALRQAMADTAADPEFLEEATSQGLEIDLVSGSKIQDLIVESYKSPKEIVEALKQASTN